MQDYMKVWIGENVVGSVGTDGTILDAADKMVGHIYLYSGEVSTGDAVAGDTIVGSVSHEGDIYSNEGKVGDIARSGNIWDPKGCKVGCVAPLQYWKASIEMYESYDAPVLLAGGAALLLVLRGNANASTVQPHPPRQPRQMYYPTIPLTSHMIRTTAHLVCS